MPKKPRAPQPTTGEAGPTDALSVQRLPVGDLKPYPGNPRHNESSIGKVAASLREFGFRQPIVVDEQMVIIAGHTRWLAAQQLGLTHVPVHVAVGLSPDQARAYRLADNRTAEDAAWDPEALKRELEALAGAGVDLVVTGFEDRELAAILGLPTGIRSSVDLDDVPDYPTAVTAKEGDLYQLGAHRVLCGDATRSMDWARLMGDDRADLILTDPPYDFAYTGKTVRKLKIQNDSLGFEGTLRMLRASLGLALAYTREGGGLYVFAPHGPEFYPFAKVGIELGWWRQTLLWIKDGFALGRSDYHYRHEAILEGLKATVVVDETAPREVEVLGYGWRPGAKHSWAGDRKQDTGWECPKPKRNAEHPTMKPTALGERAIRNSTAMGATVVDCFAGAGFTLMACEDTGRRALLMELDPAYVDVILARFERATGVKPAKVGEVVDGAA